MNINPTDRLRSMAEDLLRDKKLVIKILTVAVILALALILRIHESSGADVILESPEDAAYIPEETAALPEDETPQAGEVVVDISGAVENPGVYTADAGTRLYEIIEMAGGLRSDADTDSINQASFIEDGQKIIIPVHNDDASIEGTEIRVQTSISDGKININTATREELKTLNGIGDVMADRIIEYRAVNRFKSIDEIKSVKGIGNEVFNKIKDEITV